LEILDVKRLFVFGGAYGNFEATKAILDEAEQRGFSKEEILFTGDSIAYCANPEETTCLIKSSGIHTLEGNCEEAIANGAENCGCGFEEGTECDLLSDQWYRYCQKHVSAESRIWMAALSHHLEVRIGELTFLATHATPTSNNQFVFPSSLSHEVIEGFTDKYDGFITGHSGIPFIEKIGKKLWINSGAAGMPANDGTPRIWFATIEAEQDSLIIQTHALNYDHPSAAQAMKNAGLENGYMDCLTTGIWPSHDVLPELEKSETGTAITEQQFQFHS